VEALQPTNIIFVHHVGLPLAPSREHSSCEVMVLRSRNIHKGKTRDHVVLVRASYSVSHFAEPQTLNRSTDNVDLALELLHLRMHIGPGAMWNLSDDLGISDPHNNL
jgi:hypothetical protein